MFSRRFFSSSRSAFQKAKLTQLPNGLTVATKPSTSSTSSIGLYLNSGSRAENSFNSGVSHLLGNSLANSSVAKAALKNGVKFDSYNAKELTGVVSTFAPGNSQDALTGLSSIVSNVGKVLEDASYIKEQAAYATKIAEVFEATPKKMVVEHMIATAFQGTSLALPTYGKAETLSTLETMDLINFAKKQLLSSNVAIVATGSDIDHEKLVTFASQLSLPNGVKPTVEPFKFLGSDVRLRDDTLPDAHVAISAKVNTYSSPDFYTGLVASSINGSFAGPKSIFSTFEGSKLSQLLFENHLINEYEHFQLNFSDVALWGVYLDTSNIANLDEAVHFTLKDWNRYSAGTVSETELARAKASLKLALLTESSSSSELSTALANDVLVKGFTESAEEITKHIDSVTLSSISKWAQAHLYDQDIAMAGNGQIEALFDYNRIRNDMSMMRW